jgi:hypothetical protein
MTSLPLVRATALISASSRGLSARRGLGNRRGLRTWWAGLAPAGIRPSATARVKKARAALITFSPACRPPRPLLRRRACFTHSRCSASTSVAATVSIGQSPQAAAIRVQ